MIHNHIAQPFIIIGMHRSGTTLLAEAMNAAGICMGVMRDHNGEAFHFLSLNQQMLWAENVDWINPKVPSKENDKTLKWNEIFAEHIKCMSSNPKKLRLLHNKPWGWKDPRNTFTLKYWLNQFPKAKVIHVVRDGRSVALSLGMRNTLQGEVFDDRLNDLKFNFQLWEKYVAEGLKWESKLGTACLRVSYEDLVTSDSDKLLAINDFTQHNVKDALRIRKAGGNDFTQEINELATKSNIWRELGYHL